MKKRIISLILLVIMAIPAFAVHSSADPIGNIEENVNVTTVSNYNKLHFYFDNEEHATIDSKSELVSAMNALANRTTGYEIYNAQNADDFNDDLHITVEFASDFTSTAAYQAFAEEAQTLTTSDEVLDFRQRLNALSLKYHTALVNSNINQLSVFDSDEVYITPYSAFVTVVMQPEKLTEQSLIALCSSSKVTHISLSYESVAISDELWSECLQGVEAENVVNNSIYTGEGVRIGIYEAEGVCNTSHANLIDKDITVRSGSSVDDHATSVTSVAALLAPEAEFYVSQTLSLSQDISWFIQNNCDIINCSFSYYDNVRTSERVYTLGPRYYRYDIDGLYDFLARTHMITICKSAGNISSNNTSNTYNPFGNIVSPAYAYNVITVGGVNLDTSSSEWVHASTACYKSNSPQSKPNISAPFSVNIPNIGEKSGTSFSTPMAVGCIALLMEENASYRTKPQSIMSLITSTAKKTSDYANGTDNINGTFDEKVGAGIINLEGMISNAYRQEKIVSNSPSGAVIINNAITLNEGDEIQVAISWLVTAIESSTNSGEYTPHITNYDMRIYGPIFIEEVSEFNDSNVELIRYKATSTGTYRIIVQQFSNMDTTDYFTLTYHIN